MIPSCFKFLPFGLFKREYEAENPMGTHSIKYKFTEKSDIHLQEEVDLANYDSRTLLIEILNATKIA